MTSFRVSFLALLVLLNFSCSTTAETRLMNWLVGEWITDDGNVSETWRPVSPDTLEGIGVTTSNGKVSIEYLRLVKMGADVFYIAKVSHNDLAIAFRLSGDSTPERLIFSNPAHDFPRQIVYQRNGSNRMTVIVSDGATEGFELNFTRK